MRLDYNSLLAGHYDWIGKAIEALGRSEQLDGKHQLGQD